MANHDALLAQMLSWRSNRRALLKRAAILGLGAPALAGLGAACRAGEPAAPSPAAPSASPQATSPAAQQTPAAAQPTQAPTTAGEPRRGGRLRVATTGQPAGLDMHIRAQRTITLIGWHMYEALFTFDGNYETVPMLAAGYEVSDDGLTATIPLRRGVRFHNGEEMRAADVIASFERWAEVSSLGIAISEFLREVVAVDDYTVEFRLSSPLVALPSMLARQSGGLSIHPKSVLDQVGTEPLTPDLYIGTGPYQLVDFQPDRFTLLRRFDGYVGLDSPPSGYAGRKAAYLDEIEFVPMPDEAARVAGLQAGDFHYLEEIIPDQVEAIGDNPNLNIQILPPRSYGVLIMNTIAGPMTNVKLRQAVLAAVDVEATGQASHGEGYFEPDPGIMLPQTRWHSTVGQEYYDQGNPERARQLAQEAGYDGTPLRILTTQEDLGDYNAAVVIQQQLQQAGFNVQLEVMDEATLDEMLEDDNRWEMTTNAYVFRPDPVLIAAFASCTADGGWCSDPKVEVARRLQTETDPEARFKAFEELQMLWYTEAPAVKLVNNLGIAPLSAKVKNILETTHFEIEPEFTNCWLEE